MLSVLLEGSLTAAPVPRTASNGKPFATARVRGSGEDGETVWCSVIAFNAEAVEALRALSTGDSIAIAGHASLSTWDKDGEHQQADKAHAEPWTAEGIEAFNRCRDLLLRCGFNGDDADDLAETLARRDTQADDRRMCVECSHLGEQGRCLAAAAGKLSGADRRLEPVKTMLQRCEAFGLRKGLT